jgi:hypothetical protein
MIALRWAFIASAIIAVATPAIAKMPLKYLYNLYSEADVVARVVVISERDRGKDLAEYTLKVLKPIKGLTTERELTVAAIPSKDAPVDFPHLNDGDVGMIFLQKDKATNSLHLSNFLLAEDLTTTTSFYLCKSGGEFCGFTKFSEIEYFFKTH